MSAATSIDHANAFWRPIAEFISTGKEATMRKFALHRIAITCDALCLQRTREQHCLGFR
jgi:hypothetical protein